LRQSPDWRLTLSFPAPALWCDDKLGFFSLDWFEAPSVFRQVLGSTMRAPAPIVVCLRLCYSRIAVVSLHPRLFLARKLPYQTRLLANVSSFDARLFEWIAHSRPQRSRNGFSAALASCAVSFMRPFRSSANASCLSVLHCLANVWCLNLKISILS
jgi:hypothetical protein